MKDEKVGDPASFKVTTSSASILRWRILLIIFIWLLAGSANAARDFGTGSDRFVGYGFFARIAAERGGDDLVRIAQGNEETVRLSAGDGTLFEAGLRLDWRLIERPAWESEFALGLKQTSRSLNDGELSFQRYVLSAVQFYRFSGGLRVGVGVVLHAAAEVEAEGAGFETTSASLEKGVGPMLMLGYGWTSGWSVGLRATSVAHASGTINIDATSAGLYLCLATR